MRESFCQLLFLIIITSVIGCSPTGNGELVGVNENKKWSEKTPYGMVLIPKGSFQLGPNDQEVSISATPTKTVSVESFWMDDTEITNNEYKQFVNWVRDSIARELLSEQYPEFLITEGENDNPLDKPYINWREKIDWKNPDYQLAMQNIYIPEEERFYGRKEIDTRKLVYEYWWIDLQQAAQKQNRFNYNSQQYDGNVYNTEGILVPITNRSSFIMNEQVYVYPDTLSWIVDFTYSYNEPLTTHYFWHPGFGDYPVIGISWQQAKAFCHWRSNLQNDYLVDRNKSPLFDFRLPTEAEWEYASRGGNQNAMFPWGGYYTREEQGDFKANFKPMRGNYLADNGITVMKVGSFLENKYCLYDMAGNVAEWTSNAFDESAYIFINDLNPNLEYNAKPDDPPVMKRKVIRGGSWKDYANMIQTSTRSYEYQDSAKSYIGFRCVRSTFNPIDSKKGLN